MTEKELMLHQIYVFEKRTQLKIEVKDGKPYYNGNLHCFSVYLPDNLVIDGNLKCSGESVSLPKCLKVNGKLDISYTDIIEIPDDCDFCSLRAAHTEITKLRDNLELDSLQLYNSKLTKLPKGLKVKGLLDISHTKITEIPDDCEFSSLIIEKTKITKLRDNLVLDYLNANHSLLTSLPNGLKVKNLLAISHTDITEIPDDCEFSSLDISNTKITKLRDDMVLNYLNIVETQLEKLPINLVIYNSLFTSKMNFNTIPNDYLACVIFCDFELNDERYEKNRNGYYRLKDEIINITHPLGYEFLHVDEIFSEVVEKKGNVYHVRNGVNEPITYIVTDGNGHWAHGGTLEDAKQDLLFKISKRDKSKYEKLTLDSELTFDEAVACYRVITGACKLGTQDYLEHRLPKPKKEKYTIKEMIDLTKNEYGDKTFREFFENNK